MTSGDGIYTAFVHRGCQGGNGRHNSKVFVTGDQDTVVTLDTSSESAVLGSLYLYFTLKALNKAVASFHVKKSINK